MLAQVDPDLMTMHGKKKKKNPMAPLAEGVLVVFNFVLLHASIVVVCHCVAGDREGVSKVSMKERDTVQEMRTGRGI